MTQPSTVDASRVQEIEADYVLQVYKRLPVVLVRGDGSRVFDANGKDYLDFLSGIGVASLGHAHSRLADAVTAQARELLHTSNLFFHPLQGQVARKLAQLSGLQRTFFTNSGAEAVEACLKFARRYWHAQEAKARTQFVAFDRSFHGRTFGALSITSGAAYRDPFAPLVPGVTFVSPDEPSSLRQAVSDETAAIIVEPIQGEGGVWPISDAMVEALGAVCAETGTLLIADEIQCGLGRTGQPFRSTTVGLKPDLMALGKALGGGVPVGAAVMSERVASAVAFGDHGSTYGGNLLACRAALVFLEALETGLLDRVSEAGAHLSAGLRALASDYSVIGEIRGAGLMWGVEVEESVAERLVPVALDKGLIVNRTAGTVIRLLPPLTISNADIDTGLMRLRSAFETATARAT
jgi:predicted acetylornithine/succinylornithine family transaminase